MFKFWALVLGLLGQRIVQADVAGQVPFTSQSGYGSQYGANFNHAFADPRQDLLSDPISLTTLVGGANAVLTTVGLLTVNSRVTNNCNKLNEMLNVAELKGTTDDSIATFAYTNGISGTATGTKVTLALGSGGSYTSTSGLKADAATPAALLKDVDNLRLAVAAALLKLDTKIDEILKKATLTC